MTTAAEKVLIWNGPVQFGGPASVLVALDYGQPGQRGTNFFLSPGDPNSLLTPPVLSYKDGESFTLAKSQEFDLCINLSPTDPNYLDLYQYKSKNGILKWYNEIKLTPDAYPFNIPFIFTNGVGVPAVPLKLDIPTVLLQGLLAAKAATEGAGGTFNVQEFLATTININFQYSIENDNPVSSNITYTSPTEPVTIDLAAAVPTATLNIAIGSAEYATYNEATTWYPLSGQKLVHMVITVFDPKAVV